MSNPFPTNAICDIYWTAHGIPGDVTSVPFTLVAAWEEGQRAGTRNVPGLMYTHIGHFELTVDIRDNYIGGMTVDPVNARTLDVFDPQTGIYAAAYGINFVERVNRGQRADHLVAYLSRGTPIWPTDFL
jgi:hypothetical protein